MNILEILLFILITSNSVLCRHINNKNVDDDVANEEISIEENMENNSNKNLKLKSVNLKAPRTEMINENSGSLEQLDTESSNDSFDEEGKLETPISKKRIKKMLKKAIVQIITGDLTTADMFLLKSLNYDAEQVRKIREEKLGKKKNNQDTTIGGKENPRIRTWVREGEKSKLEHDWKDVSRESETVDKSGYDYDAFNNQATIDYEYAASNFESKNGSWDDLLSEYDERMKSSTEILPEKQGSLRPNVIFTIRYNDSEFDSSSEENSKRSKKENHRQTAAFNGTGNNFPTIPTTLNSTPSPIDDEIETMSELMNITRNYFSTTENTIDEDNEVDSRTVQSKNENIDSKNLIDITEQPEGINIEETLDVDKNKNDSEVTENLDEILSSSTTEINKVDNQPNVPMNYKGLRWVQDNVYQVIPEYLDALQTDMENETSDTSDENASYQNLDDGVVKNPTMNDEDHLGLVEEEGMTNDAPDLTQLPNSNGIISTENLTVYHRMVAGQRQAQRQKTEDEIKSRVLMVTGRLNSTNNSNPLQPRREKLAMFLPKCGIPRNTDAELWQDPYTMNMQFQLNLTFDQHLVAAKLRLYKLPQENSTTVTSTTIDGVENEEKKIRISVYYYTRSLKKHRSTRKRLMDSKVASLTTTGEHLALDVKDAARHWRSSNRNPNHGLLVLVEDQEGRPLQPNHYVQTPNCQNLTDPELQDEKAYQRVPALFVRACTRYVRLVGNEMTIEEFCGAESEPVSINEETNHY